MSYNTSRFCQSQIQEQTLCLNRNTYESIFLKKN